MKLNTNFVYISEFNDDTLYSDKAPFFFQVLKCDIKQESQ